MRRLHLAVLLTSSLLAFPGLPQAQAPKPFKVAATADGQAEFVAAGADVAKLKAVAAQFPETVWGKLAAARVKIIESQQGTATPEAATRQIEVVPKEPPPTVAVEPEPPAEATPPAVAVNPEPPPVAPPVEPPAAQSTVAPADPAVTEPPAQNQAPALRVAADGSGQYKSIVDAINAAEAGSRIEVAPGTYEGGVIIDKPLEIVGTGSFDQVTWQVTGTDLIQWKAASGLLKNMTLLQNGGCEKTCNVIYFNNGSATVENSALTGKGGASIYVQGVRSSPRIVSNNLHNSKESAIYFELASGGEAILNDIANSGFAAIEIKTNANPIIRSNKIHGGTQGGIYANVGASGYYLENEIYENTYSGLEVREGATPVARNNIIRNNADHGIYVNSKGRGLFVQNEVFANGKANIAITDGADPVFNGNTIRAGADTGVLVDEGGKGTLENNLILESVLAGIEVRGGSTPTLRKNTVRDGKQSGIYVHDRATVTLEDNDVISNGFSAVEVSERGTVTASNNRMTGNAEYAIYLHDKGGGTFKDNDFGNNGRGSSRIEKTAGKISRSGNRE
jgi:parallel beta-helix repeat protein